MLPHMADGSREHSTATTDRRTDERYSESEFSEPRYVVVLDLGLVYRAELINESHGGIGIQVRKLDPDVTVGRAIEVIYRGNRRAAEVRHLTESENGFVVGLEWK